MHLSENRIDGERGETRTG